MRKGKVVTIHIARARRAAPEPLDEARLRPGRGLPGDHHDRAGAKRAVTLIDAERLERVSKKLGTAVAPGASRRNIVVQGVDVAGLKTGALLRLGTALVEVRGPCEPCNRMNSSIGPGALAAMNGEGGVHVRVLEGGLVRPGDTVAPADDRPAAPSEPTPLQSALLAWFRANKRDLPWRRTRDPYAIWLSEVMLQQTQVATVIPYYERFLSRFPTVQDLAAAPTDDLLALWSGLGYYARARNLHRAAQLIVGRHGGTLPSSLSALRELPGFGPYTAGAVGSIALGLDAALVDGNVARVYCRIEGWPVDANEALERAWAIAAERLPRGDAGDFNQALMELGATVCTPRLPRCDVCPVRPLCASAGTGSPERYPLPKPRAPRKSLSVVSVVVRQEDGVVALKREGKGLFGGLWELPGRSIDSGEPPDDVARGLARALLGPAAEVAPVARIDHTLTHRDVTVALYEARGGGLTLPPEARLVRPAEWAGLGLSTLVAKLLAAANVPLPEGRAQREKGGRARVVPEDAERQRRLW